MSRGEGAVRRGEQGSCGGSEESRHKVSRFKEALNGGETETVHIYGAEREQTHTSETLEDRMNVKVLRALRAGSGGGSVRAPTSCRQSGVGGSGAGQSGSGKWSPENLWFIGLCFNCCVMAF